jgi:hypothetical protein
LRTTRGNLIRKPNLKQPVRGKEKERRLKTTNPY